MLAHYVKGHDWECWKIIQNGPNTILVGSNEGTTYEKNEEDYVEADYKKAEKNSKAISLLQNGKPSNELDRLSLVSRPRKYGMVLAYEGTTIVKKYCIDLLIQKYELFTMETNKSLDSMSARSSIINELKNIGRKLNLRTLLEKSLGV
ncbi:uncharacterized protein LOC141618121 [Silene latifolia]|uniref:uncharacterized protein LOC141618121 n=1 Tax=Silene latifolia TaxID=37657 RepID=UPI003D78579E